MASDSVNSTLSMDEGFVTEVAWSCTYIRGQIPLPTLSIKRSAHLSNTTPHTIHPHNTLIPRFTAMSSTLLKSALANRDAIGKIVQSFDWTKVRLLHCWPPLFCS